MAHLSGKNGGVYTSSLLIEDCEDAWTNDNLTSCNVDTDSKVGTYSIKAINPGAVGVTTLLCHEGSLGPLNLSTYDAVLMWIKDSVGVTLGQLEILLDDTDACTSPLENLDVPALTAGTWTQIFMPLANPATDTAIVAVGLYQTADLAARNTFMDDIRALKEIDGINSWSLEYTTASLDTTDFATSGVSSFIPGISEWHGSFEGYKEGVPLGIGAEVYLVLGETSVGSQCWVGKVIITSARPVTDHDGIVSYSYDFQGTAALEEPST